MTIILICINLRAMYICVCKAVTEKRIAAEVKGGAANLRDLRARTQLGTGCGKCIHQAYELIRDARHARGSHSQELELLRQA